MAKRPDTQESLVFALELLRRIPRQGKNNSKKVAGVNYRKRD